MDIRYRGKMLIITSLRKMKTSSVKMDIIKISSLIHVGKGVEKRNS
jgi:hypothetical protein